MVIELHEQDQPEAILLQTNSEGTGQTSRTSTLPSHKHTLHMRVSRPPTLHPATPHAKQEIHT